jgi:hypothetical protein
LKQVYFLLMLFSLPVLLFAQPDSSLNKKDSFARKDSVIKSAIVKPAVKVNPVAKYDSVLQALLSENRFLNINSKPIASTNHLKRKTSQDFLFYLMLSVMFLLAFFRLFYQRYFKNLFRVFFNTSLRQSQLTDQLLQAKLASLFFNLFFTITGGIYVYFLLRYFNWIKPDRMITLMSACVICFALIYLGKFIVLKFTGWLTGYKEVTNTYLFIIFLINKILGVLLVPVIIIMAFSASFLVKWVVTLSLLFIALLLLLRFFRSYGLLQNQLKVSRLHFLLYILGTEVVPLLLIYKGLMILVS